MFGELDTYSLIDFFPFDAESYLSLFRLQNEAWWPLHVFIAIALFVPLAIVAVSWRSEQERMRLYAVRALQLFLVFAWASASWFILIRYSTLNWAAYNLGFVFFGQAILMLLMSVLGAIDVESLPPKERGPTYWAGALFVLFALFGYPAFGLAFGHGWSGIEFVGLAPDPTAIATIGIMLMCRKPYLWLLAVPAAWSAAAGLTAFALELEVGLFTAALAAIGVSIAALRRLMQWRDGATSAGVS